MRRAAALSAGVLLALTANATAVSLVVMGVNTTAVPGDKVFTIGIQIQQSDLAPSAAGNSVLFVQQIEFGGGSTNPIQQPGSTNEPDLQDIQSNYIDPSSNSGPATNLGTTGDSALYRDSWWYSGNSLLDSHAQLVNNAGVMQGVNDRSGDIGPITTSPAGDGSGPYAIGPAENLGALGYTFSSFPGNVDNTTNGHTMSFTGLYGPLGSDFLNKGALADQFVNGSLTVPLAQIVASGNIPIPSDWDHGRGTGIIVGDGDKVYNVLGGPADVDPAAFLDFNNNSIVGGGAVLSGTIPVIPDNSGASTDVRVRGPEPSSFVLAGLGSLLLVLSRARWAMRKSPA